MNIRPIRTEKALLGITQERLRDAVNGWRARRDSNPRPSVPKTDALSAELRAREYACVDEPREGVSVTGSRRARWEAIDKGEIHLSWLAE